MIITDDDVEAACAAYWTDWPRMKNWPKTGPTIRASMRRALEAVIAARAAKGPHSLFDQVAKILEGIDEEECEHPKGWWETWTGAMFGSQILDDVRTVLVTVPPPEILAKIRELASQGVCNGLTADAKCEEILIVIDHMKEPKA